MGNLGIAYGALGQEEKAIEHLKESLRIFEEIKSPIEDIVRKWLDEIEGES